METRQIASLRIHVERAMERIKNYHIFDRTLPSSLNDVAEETFLVCCDVQLLAPFMLIISFVPFIDIGSKVIYNTLQDIGWFIHRRQYFRENMSVIISPS